MTPRLTWGLAGGWCLLVLAALTLIVIPAWQRSRALEVRLVELREELDASQDDPDVLEDLGTRLDSLRRFGEGRMTPIPEESDIAGLMHSLTSILDGKSLLEREIKMGAATEMERATSIPMTVMIRGDFAGVFAALSEIETMDRLIRVRRLKIGNDNGRARELVRDGVVTATLTMDVFYGPRDEAGPDKSKGKRS